MEVQIGETKFSRFTNVSANIRLDALVNTFEFTAVDNLGGLIEINSGDFCKVFADGEVVVTGYIDKVSVRYSKGQHIVQAKGRSKTSDIVDSSLAGGASASSSTLVKIIEDTIDILQGSNEDGAPIPFIKVIVEEGVKIEPFSEAEDKLGPAVGENIFKYFDRLARKRQVILRSNTAGDIVITRGSTKTTGITLHHSRNSDKNNVISAEYISDDTKRYGKYQCVSQLGASSSRYKEQLKEAAKEQLKDTPFAHPSEEIVADYNTNVASNGIFPDDSIRETRHLVVKAEKNYSSGQLNERAEWEYNVRTSRSKKYVVKVNDYRTEKGELWNVNLLVDIVEAFVGNIDNIMLIGNVNFSFDLKNGRQTTLTLLQKDAFSDFLPVPEGADFKPQLTVAQQEASNEG